MVDTTNLVVVLFIALMVLMIIRCMRKQQQRLLAREQNRVDVPRMTVNGSGDGGSSPQDGSRSPTAVPTGEVFTDDVEAIAAVLTSSRKEYIDKHLIEKAVLEDTTNSSQSSERRKRKGNLVAPVTEESGSTRSVDSRRDEAPSDGSCAICLGNYSVGETICWSSSPTCDHCFHRDCIHEWLMNHDDCPCCRTNYFTMLDEEEATA